MHTFPFEYIIASFTSTHSTAFSLVSTSKALVYLNYMISLIQKEIGGIVCSNEDNYGCVIGNKVVGWLLTATFCG